MASSAREIALLFDVHVSYGRGILRGVRDYVRRHADWAIVLSQNWQEMVPQLREGRYAGLIVQVASSAAAGELEGLACPIVNVSGGLADMSLPRVCSDDVAVGRMAAEYFIAAGFRSLGFCGFGETSMRVRRFVELRGAGLASRAEESGIACSCLPPLEAGLDSDGQNSSDSHIRKWLATVPRPAGIMGVNDNRARHVIDAARALDLRVPEDIAVIGVDNDEVECEWAPIPISSVALNLERIGFEAARVLGDLLNGEPAPPAPMFIAPLHVVTRQSSDTLAIEDEAVAVALRFIRLNSGRPLEVDEVAEAAMLSRRSLERRFRAALGHAPHDEIRRCQVDRARQLLAGTLLNMGEVAKAAGFANAKNFGTLFRRAMGMPPRAYRKQFRLHTG